MGYRTTFALVVLCCILAILLSKEHLQNHQATASEGFTNQNINDEAKLTVKEDEDGNADNADNTDEEMTTAAARTLELIRSTSSNPKLAEPKLIVDDDIKKQLEELRTQLESYKKQNEDLKQKLAASCGSSEQQQQQQPTLKESLKEGLKKNLKKITRAEEDESPIYHRHPVCQKLSQKVSPSSTTNNNNNRNNKLVIPSTSFLWTESLAEIHTASDLLPNDPKYLFHDYTAHLLHLVSSRLHRTTQTLPRKWTSLHSVLEIAWARYDYFQQHPEVLQSPTPGQPPQLIKELKKDGGGGDDIPRPVHILIMGGSILQGTNCRKMIRDLQMKEIGLSLQTCSWGNRLGAFINQVLGYPLVEITTIGVGGTNTATGSLLLHHNLLPPKSNRPDIIINGYSTNDMHAWTMTEAGHSNTTLGDQVRTMVEDFYRNATKLGQEGTTTTQCDDRRRRPPPPLFLYLDDYIGNEQREILNTMEGSSAVQSLARYYGFATFSYSDLVRDWVYGDTKETWFSPGGWYNNNDGNVMIREIHPQLGAHIVLAWVVAYNMLHMVTTFCSIEPWLVNKEKDGKGGGAIIEDMLSQSYETTQQQLHPQLPTLRGETNFVPPGKPNIPPLGLPPRLTKTLSLEEISDLWHKEGAKYQDKKASMCQEEQGGKKKHQLVAPAKCPFAWVTRIRVLPLPNVPETDTGNDGDAALAYWKAHAVSEFGDPKNSDWAFQNDHMKIGVSPKKGIGSELRLEIPPPQKSAPQSLNAIDDNDDADDQSLVDTLTIFYMKSYGELWKDSTVKLDVLAKSRDQITKDSSSSSSSDWTNLSSVELVGFHAKNTSETYTETINLPSSTNIGKLSVVATLMNGGTFKIMGLLVCRLGEQD